MQGKYRFEIHLANDQCIRGNMYNIENPDATVMDFFTVDIHSVSSEDGSVMAWRGAHVVNAVLTPYED